MRASLLRSSQGLCSIADTEETEGEQQPHSSPSTSAHHAQLPTLLFSHPALIHPSILHHCTQKIKNKEKNKQKVGQGSVDERDKLTNLIE